MTEGYAAYTGPGRDRYTASGDVTEIVVLTQAAYNALDPPEDGVVYLIVG